MKKALFIAVALFTIGFTSCKKDWTCDCGDPDSNFEIKETTKTNAKALCEGKTPISGNLTGCKLK